MPFVVPTLSQLQEKATRTIVYALNKGGPVRRRRVEEALGAAIGGIQYLGIERLLVLWEQLWVDTATGRWLDRHGAIWGVPRKDRVKAKGKIKVPGEDGSQLGPGTEFEAVNANGDTVTFVTDAKVEVEGEEAFVTVTAVVAGAASNLPVGAELALTIGVAGFDGTAEVVLGDLGENGIVGGLDLEGDDDYRPRILFRIANPPQGGSAEDYRGWALEVPGVTRAWVVPKANGPGTVAVLVVDDNSDPIIPTQDVLDAVLAHIETPAGVAPVTDYVSVAAPELLEVDFEITLSPNTEAVQSAVLSELKDFFRGRELGRDEPFVHLSQVGAAIDGADGENWHEITSPASSPEVGEYQIPVLGNVTFNNP